ncbi:MAG TPA: hypothetical protein DDZ44_04535 [Syntrophomonas wolfei]|uniref:Uncharacterized protein n=1 Tax=Syntrophomonas wolfei TaxID=863 RepID=A0A354YY84_9FIRM|nr:hypothetical protein [Syntrophomonas wolfei]
MKRTDITKPVINIDKRTHGAKHRAEAILSKTENVLHLIQNALDTGLTAVMSLWTAGLQPSQ